MHQARCQCSQAKYQLKGEPLTCYTCHCTDCQSESGSAFTLSMVVNAADVELVQGDVKVDTYHHNNTEIKRHSCHRCGSALWFSADSIGDYYALKAGAFEDSSWIKPIAHLWTGSAQPWLQLDDDIPRYEAQPEMKELFDLWRNKD